MPNNELIIRIFILIVITIILVFRNKIFNHILKSKFSKKALSVFLIISIIFLISPNFDLKLSMLGNTDRFLDVVLINPYNFMMIVAIASGFETFAVVIMDFIGKEKSLLVTGIVGGLPSSTALSQLMAIKSRSVKDKGMSFAALVIIANASSLIKKIFYLVVLNINLLVVVFPLMIGRMLLVGYIGMRQLKKVNDKFNIEKLNLNFYKPSTIIIFAITFFVVGLIKQILPILFSQNSNQVLAESSSLFGGFDITIIEVSKELAVGKLELVTAVVLISIASFQDIIGKIIYGFILGTREYFKEMVTGLGLTLIATLIAQYFWFIIFFNK